jgi:hypothetical protein
MNIWALAGAFPVALVFLTGCESAQEYSLTHKLWSNEDFRKFSEPAPRPSLALFKADKQDDVLAQYDAYSEKHSRIERRAYFLRANAAIVPAAKKPRFVAPALADGMKPIPLIAFSPDGVHNEPSAAEYARPTRDDSREFILYRPQGPPETFELPVYSEGGGFTRVALTPLAVAGDAVMVCGVAAVAGFIAWLTVGAPH